MKGSKHNIKRVVRRNILRVLRPGYAVFVKQIKIDHRPFLEVIVWKLGMNRYHYGSVVQTEFTYRAEKETTDWIRRISKHWLKNA